MKSVLSNLTFQVLVAIALGILVGVLYPGFASYAELISKSFINMISMLIAPIIFFTIVLGIAHMGDMKKVGRVGGKALIYFEIVTTLAIIIGMVVANLLEPGVGVTAAGLGACVSRDEGKRLGDHAVRENKLLETYPTAGRVRPNKSAVQALLARTYLYLQDWSNAEKYASTLIGKTNSYNLVDFNAVFLANSPEAIWQLEPASGTNAAEGLFFIPANLTTSPTVAKISIPSCFRVLASLPSHKIL